MSRRSLSNLYNEEASSHTHVDTVKTPDGGEVTHFEQDKSVGHGHGKKGCCKTEKKCDTEGGGGYGGYGVAWFVVIFFIIFFIVWIFLHLFNHEKLRKHECNEPDLGRTLLAAFIITLVILFIVWIIWAVSARK